MNKRSRRKKSKTQNSQGQLILKMVLIALFLFTIIALFNQGIIGELLNKIYSILFGTMLIPACIYLLNIFILLILNKAKVLLKSKLGISLNVFLLVVYLIISYLSFNVQRDDLISFSTYFYQLMNGNIFGTGIVGYLLLSPIIILIGKIGFWFVIVFLILALIFINFDIKKWFELIGDKIQTMKIMHVEKKLKKIEKEKEQAANEENSKIEEVSHNNFEEDTPVFPDADTHTTNLQVEMMETEIPQQNIKNKKLGKYKLPSLDLLNSYTNNLNKLEESKKAAQLKAKIILNTLENFNLKAKINNINVGPSIIKYELVPEAGTKINKFNSLHNDLAFALAAKNVRIEAPIPGKSAIGIEIPNDNKIMVGLREVLCSSKNDYDKKLQIGLGKNIYGQAEFCEIDKTPHLLIAGSTGSGKSVCVNSIIISILTKASPNEVKMIMIDPKKVELTPYNGIPHLLAPVVTEPKKANIILQKMVKEMERRYELFADTNTRNIQGYNEKIKDKELKLPYIVIIVDELADLMMVASKDVETSIARLAQMARAAGMHLIIATQRPSTDVITGLIKANIPSRIAFAVSSSIDSRTILDQSGAEQLLGQGDMLFANQSSPTLERIQGAFLSDKEILAIIDFIKSQFSEEEVVSNYDDNLTNEETLEIEEELDPLYQDVKNYIIDTQKASASLIQRQFKVGYNRALRILDQLEAHGIISPNEGTKPRRVLVEEYDEN